MELRAYNGFNKRKNSTKRPSGGSTRNVVLLEDCSLYEPIFECNYWDYNDNYIKWAGRYYYVTDVVSVRRDLFDVHCVVDALATWKSDVLSTNAFVTFSSSDYDIGIPDYRLSSDPTTISKFSHQTVFGELAEAYVVSYVGKYNAPSVGLSQSLLSSLQGRIMSNDFINWINNPSQYPVENVITKFLGNTSDAITRCIYMPKFKALSSGQSIILAGGWDSGIAGEVPSHKYEVTYNVSIPWAFPSGDFRNRAQFTGMAIYLPGYGFISLNADNYQGQSSISVQCTLDSYSGEITYLIGGKSKATCSTAYPVQVGTSQQGNITGTVGGIAQSVIGLTTQEPIMAVQGAFNTAKSLIGTDASSVGSAGGSTAFTCHDKITIVIMAHNTNVEPSSVGSTVGRPLNAVRNIGELSGYVQCAKAIVPTSAPDPYKQQLNDALNGGMYIE